MMSSKKTTDIIVCLLWWLTISIVFPFQAKKRGLVKRRWARIVLTLISPAAVTTYLLVWMGCLIGRGSDISPDELAFKTREDIMLLTGIQSVPEFEMSGCWRDFWEGTISASFKYAEDLSPAFLEELEKVCSDENSLHWSNSEFTDSVFVFERGWHSDYMEKPSDSFPDNVSVQVRFSDKGFSVQYDYQPFVFKGLCTPEDLTERTGVCFPMFDIVDYRWHPVGPDAVASMTLILREKPGNAFFREVRDKWKESDPGVYVWNDGDYDEEGIPSEEYTILVDKNSLKVSILWASY